MTDSKNWLHRKMAREVREKTNSAGVLIVFLSGDGHFTVSVAASSPDPAAEAHLFGLGQVVADQLEAKARARIERGETP